jgi:hypothetical protein
MSSTGLLDEDQGLWQLYLVDCANHGMEPSIKDYLIWKEEEGYDADEPDWDNTMTDERAEDMFQEQTDVN